MPLRAEYMSTDCDDDMFAIKHKNYAQTGFTLMEVMVAIAIMGVSLIGLMHIFSSLLSGIGKAELYAEGTMVAREVLERSLIGRRLEEGVYTGEVHDMFQWELIVTRRETAVDLQEGIMAMESSASVLPISWIEEESLLEMYELTVTVRWPDTPYPGNVTLTTLRALVNPDLAEEMEG
jgi:prepilin-type N-terminal cleavage/methylation domain-containing protein